MGIDFGAWLKDNWLDLAKVGTGAALGYAGIRSANNAANQQNQNVQNSQAQLMQLAEEDRKRRDALSQMFMPSLLRDMGFRSGQRQGMLGSLFSQAGSGQSMAQPGTVPDPQGYATPNDLIQANDPYAGEYQTPVSGGDASVGPAGARQRRGAL